MKNVAYLVLALLFGAITLAGLILFFVGINSSNPDSGKYGLMLGLPIMGVFGFLTSTCWKQLYK